MMSNKLILLIPCLTLSFTSSPNSQVKSKRDEKAARGLAGIEVNVGVDGMSVLLKCIGSYVSLRTFLTHFHFLDSNSLTQGQ